MTPLAILGTGMVTGVGFSAPASCAAIRAAIAGFVETRFMYDGEFIQGCPVPFQIPYRGRRKLIEMAALALQEALAPLAAKGVAVARVPVLMCLSEPDRPGRFAGLDDTFLQDVAQQLNQRLHPQSTLFTEGRIGGVKALAYARQLMDCDPQIQHVLVVGTDTFLVAATLTHYHEQRRLLTADNSDGFIPGEAACAVLLGPATKAAAIAVTGIGFGDEPAPINSEEPLRADGLTAAIKQAVAAAGVSYPQMAYRLTDNSGEQYGFKESALAMTRVVRPTKPEFNIEHPADCIGEVGAAMVPALLAVADMAERKSYYPGQSMGDVVMCHVGADASDRAAFIVRSVAAMQAEQGRAA